MPVIDRCQAREQTVVVRADAAFALPALYEALERRDVAYAIRLPANQVLEGTIEDLLTRPRGRPSYAPLVRYRSFQYQAASWDRPRRVIAKVEHHLGELFPRVEQTTLLRLLGRQVWSVYGPSVDTGGLPTNGARTIYAYPTIEALIAGESRGGEKTALPGPGSHPSTERSGQS